MFILRGQLLESMGKLTEAIAQWEEFLALYPTRPEVGNVEQRVARAKANRAAARPAALTPPPVAAPVPPKVTTMPEVANLAWAPPDVDELAPPMEKGVACALPDVLKATRRHVTSMVENLQSFTAREHIRRRKLDVKLGDEAEWTFEYQALIEQPRPGYLAVTDYRTQVGSTSPYDRENKVSALALMFHPYYSDDFEMRCEGRSELDGQPAWVVYFRQRADKLPRVRTYREGGRAYQVRLKGRAWISANSYQIIRLETDMLEPIPELRLARDRIVVTYAPVKFTKRNQRIWLPQSADIYTDLGGRRYHDRHTYSDFMLFAVDTRHKVDDPQVPDPPR